MGRFVLPWSTLYSAKCSLKGQFLVDEPLGAAKGGNDWKGRFDFLGGCFAIGKECLPSKGKERVINEVFQV